MPRKEVFQVGKFKYSYKQYDVEHDLLDANLKGRTYKKEFAQQLIAAGMVIYPIITTMWEGKEYIADGRDRLLHSRKLATMSESEFRELTGPGSEVKQVDFRYITAKLFYDVHPDDNATWSIILNEERKDNLIFSWLQVKELQKAGKWDDIVKMHKLNKARFEKFATLDKLKEPAKWVAAYSEGRVTEATIVGIAKLGGRQGFVEEILDKKGKVTGSDVAIAKTVSVSAAINNAPVMNIPVQFVQRVSANLFVVFDPGIEHMAKIGGGYSTSDYAKALEVKREATGEHHIYRLVEVGNDR